MLRKYLVLGIMMGALALTGCGAEEEKNNDKEEVKATQEAEKDNEKVDEEKDTEDDNTADKNSEEENPTEGLYYMYGGENLDVIEWEILASSSYLKYYAPKFGPSNDGIAKFIEGYLTRLTIVNIEKEDDRPLDEVLTGEYVRWAEYSDIDYTGKGEIKDVTGEYVTVNGIECYKYSGTANRGTYVTGYMMEIGDRWVMFQMNVRAEDEEDIPAAKEEADHNIEVVAKGFNIVAAPE